MDEFNGRELSMLAAMAQNVWAWATLGELAERAEEPTAAMTLACASLRARGFVERCRLTRVGDPAPLYRPTAFGRRRIEELSRQLAS